MTEYLNMILAGIVGSHAYGLNHADSDIDMLGVYQEWTVNILGTRDLEESKKNKEGEPDWQAHEVGKFVRLVAKMNLTVTELLWLEPELYAVLTPEGQMLIDNREIFLSTNAFNSYGGYARQQFDRLKRTGKFDSDKDSFDKRCKHGRHLARLLFQGREVLTEGQLTVRLTPSQISYCREVGYQAANGDTSMVDDLLFEYDELKDSDLLPPDPDWARIDELLVQLRLIDLDAWAS